MVEYKEPVVPVPVGYLHPHPLGATDAILPELVSVVAEPPTATDEPTIEVDDVVASNDHIKAFFESGGRDALRGKMLDIIKRSVSPDDETSTWWINRMSNALPTFYDRTATDKELHRKFVSEHGEELIDDLIKRLDAEIVDRYNNDHAWRVAKAGVRQDELDAFLASAQATARDLNRRTHRQFAVAVVLAQAILRQVLGEGMAPALRIRGNALEHVESMKQLTKIVKQNTAIEWLLLGEVAALADVTVRG